LAQRIFELGLGLVAPSWLPGDGD